jgi:hypothetical protein
LYPAASPASGIIRPTTSSSVYYHIPQAATKNILEIIKAFSTLVVQKSNPAAVRARTLAYRINSNRSILTGICSDPYWNEPNKNYIYPWSTFQFLSTKDWSSVTQGNQGKIQYDEEWTGFISDLRGIYNGSDNAPKLEISTGVESLYQLKFTGTNAFPACKLKRQGETTVSVKFQEVQTILAQLQEEYNRHTSAIWDILNSLIFVVEDPDTKTPIASLHPNVFQNDSTQAYVSDKAKEARKAIRAFYTNVERIYVDGCRSLKPE